MLNEVYREMLNHKNAIRVINEWGTERAKVIGYENLFDYSLGNPSVPTHPKVTEAMVDLLQNEDPMKVHGYSPTLGNPVMKKAVAEYLTGKFGVEYKPEGIFPTSGAAGAISHAVRAISKPGDEIVTFAPYFSEYTPYIEGAGCKLKVVPANLVDFQINFEKLEEMLNPNVAAVLVNTPNNPSGVVYSEETLTALAKLLTDKSNEYGHIIYMISDEPYREIVFDGKEQPYPAKFYDNTLSCYSWSKSISLPGDRIGYVAVSTRFADWQYIVPMCGQISRGIGHNCPSNLQQLAVSRVLTLTSDLGVYETNANLLYNELKRLGFDVQKPGGTFYIFPKALEEDAVKFCEKGRDYDLLLVPSDGFGVKGYFRMAYCVETEKVERSLYALQKLAAAYK